MQLLELHLLTPDLVATKNFYGGHLGFEIAAFTSCQLLIKAGKTNLLFQPSNGAAAHYHFAFNIPSNKIEEAFQYMKERVPILSVEPGQFIADFKNWNAKAFYFLDNNQNIVEFIARYDLQENREQPFTPHSVLSVSEIGVVTDDVFLACRQIEELWNVPPFFRQKPAQNFAALGDDNGLFIVVRENRNWYPTNLQAVKSGMKAVFQTADQWIRVLELS